MYALPARACAGPCECGCREADRLCRCEFNRRWIARRRKARCARHSLRNQRSPFAPGVPIRIRGHAYRIRSDSTFIARQASAQRYRFALSGSGNGPPNTSPCARSLGRTPFLIPITACARRLARRARVGYWRRPRHGGRGGPTRPCICGNHSRRSLHDLFHGIRKSSRKLVVDFGRRALDRPVFRWGEWTAHHRDGMAACAPASPARSSTPRGSRVFLCGPPEIQRRSGNRRHGVREPGLGGDKSHRLWSHDKLSGARCEHRSLRGQRVRSGRLPVAIPLGSSFLAIE